MVLVHRGSVNAWECDERGHMNVQFFAGRSSDAGYALGRRLGVYGGAERIGLAVLEQHVRYHRELMAGDLIAVDAAVLDLRERTMRVAQHVREEESGALAATFVVDFGCFDLVTRKLAPWPERVRDAASAMGGAPDPLAAPRGLPPEASDRAPTREKAEAAGMALTHMSCVNTWECDSNGHLNIRGYLARFSECQAHLWNMVGLPRSRQRSSGLGTATAEHRIVYLKELAAGAVVEVMTAVVGESSRSVRFRHWMFEAAGGDAVASADGVAVVFDKASRRTMSLDDARGRGTILHA